MPAIYSSEVSRGTFEDSGENKIWKIFQMRKV
jgi:hypothetical protein